MAFGGIFQTNLSCTSDRNLLLHVWKIRNGVLFVKEIMSPSDAVYRLKCWIPARITRCLIFRCCLPLEMLDTRKNYQMLDFRKLQILPITRIITLQKEHISNKRQSEVVKRKNINIFKA